MGIAAVIVGFIWGRKASPAAVDRKGLAESERKALLEQVEAEKLARGKVEQARDQLAKDLKASLAWYNRNQEAITDAAQQEFSDLSIDPDALDRKLSDLLGATGDET